MKKQASLPGKDLALMVSGEIDELLVSARDLTPAGFIDQAIDELAVIAPSDTAVGRGQKAPKRFRITLERFDKLTQVAAVTGMSENDVTIAAIRQYARNHLS